jgi:hypothetical protein
MDKDAARRGHDLMLKRIEQSLKDEDRDNAKMWRGKSDAECARAIAQLSRLGDALVRASGKPLVEFEPEFPGLPRRRNGRA